MRILTITAVVFLLLAGLCRASFAEIMSSEKFKATGKIQVINMVSWKITGVIDDKNGTPVIQFERAIDGEVFEAYGAKGDDQDLATYLGLKNVQELIGQIITTTPSIKGLEQVINEMVLTGCPNGQALLKSMVFNIINGQELKLPKGINLDAGYFNVAKGKLIGTFEGRLQTAVKNASKGKTRLELAGKNDSFTTLVKTSTAGYYVAIVKATGQRKRLIISDGNAPILWDSPRELTDMEMEEITGPKIGSPSPNHNILQKAAESFRR